MKGHLCRFRSISLIAALLTHEMWAFSATNWISLGVQRFVLASEGWEIWKVKKMLKLYEIKKNL